MKGVHWSSFVDEDRERRRQQGTLERPSSPFTRAFQKRSPLARQASDDSLQRLPRRPHSAPAQPNSLDYAMQALRLHTTNSHSSTVPSARSTSVARSHETSGEKSQRNSVGLDSAIGLDDGRMSSTPSSTSSTPVCQPNTFSRRSHSVTSTLSSTLTPAASTTSCGAVSASAHSDTARGR